MIPVDSHKRQIIIEILADKCHKIPTSRACIYTFCVRTHGQTIGAIELPQRKKKTRVELRAITKMHNMVKD